MLLVKLGPVWNWSWRLLKVVLEKRNGRQILYVVWGMVVFRFEGVGEGFCVLEYRLTSMVESSMKSCGENYLKYACKNGVQVIWGVKSSGLVW